MDEPIKPDGGANPPQPDGGQNNPPKPAGELDPEIQRRDGQISHWREKAEKAEAELAKLKPAEPAKPEEVEFFEAPTDPLEVVKLGKALKDYDQDETEFIIRNAKTKDIDGIIKAEKDEWVQQAIKSRREKVAKENKVPPPGAPGGGFNEKSPQDIAKMSREEHMAYEKEVQQKMQGEGGI